MSLKWLAWTQQLQAIAQNGLTYSNNPYDIERYKQLRLSILTATTLFASRFYLLFSKP